MILHHFKNVVPNYIDDDYHCGTNKRQKFIFSFQEQAMIAVEETEHYNRGGKCVFEWKGGGGGGHVPRPSHFVRGWTT